MTTGRIGVGFVIVLWMLMEAFSVVASANENIPNTSPDLTATKLIERLGRLENRLADLEGQVATLQHEKMEAQENLKRQQEADAALQSQMAHQTASATVHSPPDEATDPREDRPRHDLVSSWGVRAGYQGFPFGQKEGGFFCGIFLDHELVQQREGMPEGDLDLELGAGVAWSGNDEVTVKSAVVGAPTNVELRQSNDLYLARSEISFKPLEVLRFRALSDGGPGDLGRYHRDAAAGGWTATSDEGTWRAQASRDSRGQSF